ncbi:hypothetical protein CLAFUW4_11571 [Fulvia fulva]|uniref:Uncharacterized protein n=1 Tax=Passalora fulva TaxID=5499 RepID=A0A9Q8PBQ6_PASFU|nr:uncharacterized protein CLAFUR5_10614 [Fulvia fulva]KAK4619600.1 hypothetical protein CLAFUR4_11576 [Fulvia fulva]KAK4620334.1 hypothetical protein CLAFUR0_11585 [Fulvia fulva]UJO19548.1 hypothetical protein CLAFUR5_10614 [Fulvia fulva]WPV17338.1 hypothetical protein CLAFUW4_11571 [Fulvia fulva]WPV32062.1 hypothetical protein CLAFUW7_11575 [Fulvia fulva]
MAQHTLQTIPAELRNNIYELAFTSDQEGPIEFCKAAPPSNALLLACKQIHNEAVQIYRAAYHRYWSTSEFVIDILESDLTDDEKAAIRRIHPQDVERIPSLILTNHTAAWRLENNGRTEVMTPRFDEDNHELYVVVKTRTRG